MLLDLNDGSYSVGLGTIPNNKNKLTEATHYIRNTLDTISCISGLEEVWGIA